jgi:hypothetical protein
MHDVAPRAVTIAVAILAIICTMNFIVSFFVIAFNVIIVSLVRLASPRMFNGQCLMVNGQWIGWGLRPSP